MDRGFGGAGGDLPVALVAVPVCLLEPVEAAGEGSETDADEAEDGTGEAGDSGQLMSRDRRNSASGKGKNSQLHALALLLNARAGALLAHLAVNPFGLVAEQMQRRDLIAGSVHVGLADGLHGDGLTGSAKVSFCLLCR